MQDLIRLLQMLQGNGGMPPQNSPMGPFDQRTSMERNMLQGDPMADAIFQQGHGPMPNIPEPQYEQSRHPGWDSAIGGIADAAENSGFRPRNFGEALGANFIGSAARTYTDKGPGAREARNVESKLKYKEQVKAAHEDRMAAQKAYSGLAEKRLGQRPDKPEPTIDEQVAREEAITAARIRARDKTNRELGIPRWKPEPSMDGLDSLTQDFLANMYADYGSLPPRGILTNPAGRSILSQAARIDGANPMAGKADLAANQGSLVQITKNLNAVQAFGRTAEKNAKVMLAVMKNIPDTGSPFLNKPIRELSNAVGGNAEMAAYKAAVRVVIPEFARLLTSQSLAGQLTDTAQREMEHVIAGDYSLKQMEKVFEVLRQDKENRITDLSNQKNQIRQTIRNPLSGGADVSVGGTVKWGLDANGKPVKIGGQ